MLVFFIFIMLVAHHKSVKADDHNIVTKGGIPYYASEEANEDLTLIGEFLGPASIETEHRLEIGEYEMTVEIDTKLLISTAPQTDLVFWINGLPGQSWLTTPKIGDYDHATVNPFFHLWNPTNDNTFSWVSDKTEANWSNYIQKYKRLVPSLNMPPLTITPGSGKRLVFIADWLTRRDWVNIPLPLGFVIGAYSIGNSKFYKKPLTYTDITPENLANFLTRSLSFSIGNKQPISQSMETIADLAIVSVTKETITLKSASSRIVGMWFTKNNQTINVFPIEQILDFPVTAHSTTWNSDVNYLNLFAEQQLDGGIKSVVTYQLSKLIEPIHLQILPKTDGVPMKITQVHFANGKFEEAGLNYHSNSMTQGKIAWKTRLHCIHAGPLNISMHQVHSPLHFLQRSLNGDYVIKIKRVMQ